jgi:hypothetical protein
MTNPSFLPIDPFFAGHQLANVPDFDCSQSLKKSWQNNGGPSGDTCP